MRPIGAAGYGVNVSYRIAGVQKMAALMPAICAGGARMMAWMEGMMGIWGLRETTPIDRMDGILGPPLGIGLSGCDVGLSGCDVGLSGSRWSGALGWLGLDCSLPGFAVADQPYGRRFCALLLTRLVFRPGTGRSVWRLGRTRLLRLVGPWASRERRCDLGC